MKKILRAPFLLKKMEKTTFGGLFDCRRVVLDLVGLQDKVIHFWRHCCYQKYGEIQKYKYSGSLSENQKVDFQSFLVTTVAPKQELFCLEALQGPILLFYSQISPQKWIFPFFWVKKVPENFFSLQNMLNLATFLVLAKKFSVAISRGPLSRWKRYFIFLTKTGALKIFFH